MTNPRPILLGYIRADMLTVGDNLAAVEARLEEFAETEEYTLGTVYVERGRTWGALDALTDEIAWNEDTRGLVVPDGRHLADAETWAVDGNTVLVARSSP